MTKHYKTYSYIALLMLIVLTNACNFIKNEPMKIIHTKLTTDGLQDGLAAGVSAPYAAHIGNRLIVAGGCNFPDKPPYEGGAKIYYDEIVMLDSDNPTEWKQVGTLPVEVAYGVSITLDDNSAVWLGGNNDSTLLTDVCKVTVDSDEVNINPLANLPATMDNFAGCAHGNTLFVGGGSVDGKPSNAFYTLNTDTENGTWVQLPDFPGIPRVQPVMATRELNGIPYVYLLGGLFGGDALSQPELATDILRYDINEKKWEQAGEQIDPDSGEPFSLAGATMLAVQDRYLLAIGGVNYNVFLDALTSIHSNAHNTEIDEDERKQRARTFSLNYMTQPVDYYKFNREYRLYDVVTNSWATVDKASQGARAGAVLVGNENEFFVVQGELKPGVRTPETWEGSIK